MPTSPSSSPTRLLAQGPIRRAGGAAGGRMSPQLWVGPGPGATRLSVPVPSPQGLHALLGRGHPAVPLSLQVPPGPALVWASRGRAAKSGKLHPSQKPILSPHTEGGRARIGASGLAGVRASVSPSGKGWRRWQCPRVGGARGLRHLPALGTHLRGSSCITWAGNTPLPRPPLPETSSSERLPPDYNLGGIGPGTSLKTGLFLYKF